MNQHIRDTYLDQNCIIRFKSNDQIPFSDYLEANTDMDADEIEEHKMLRDQETLDFINNVYIPGRAARTDEQKAEEAFEMRAAFGPGEEIIDVLSGERFVS